MPYNFKRMAPPLQRPRVKSGMMNIGGEWLDMRDGLILLEYLKDFNASKAAERAGISSNNAPVYASLALRKPKVLMALHQELKARRSRVESSIDETARYWHSLATADARELNPLKYCACRFCWGIDFQYQFTLNELRQLRSEHHRKMQPVRPEKRSMLDEMGGDGYDRTAAPNEDCPECNGVGIPQIIPIDLTKLSYGASLLYDGIKVNPNGSVEFKLRDRSRAMENFQQLMGYVKPKRAVWDFNFSEMPDDQLDALLSEASSRGLLTSGDLERSQDKDKIIDGDAVDVTPLKLEGKVA